MRGNRCRFATAPCRPTGDIYFRRLETRSSDTLSERLSRPLTPAERSIISCGSLTLVQAVSQQREELLFPHGHPKMSHRAPVFIVRLR